MNLRDLQYVVTVAELASFSAAAQQCHVSQPTLSNQIKKLEEFIGGQLFERTNKKVMITELGEQLLPTMRNMLAGAAHIKEIAELAQDPLAGRFRLGAFPTLSTYIFPQIVPKLKMALPNIRWILMEEKTAVIIERLKSGELDAALLALPLDEPGLEYKALFDDAFFLATAPTHPLAAKEYVSDKDLATQKLLLLDEGHCLRDQSLDVCTRIGVEEQDFRATGLETLRQMVKAGTGITLMPEIAISNSEIGIHYVPFKAPVPKRTIGLVWRKTSSRTAVIEVLAKLIDV